MPRPYYGKEVCRAQREEKDPPVWNERLKFVTDETRASPLTDCLCGMMESVITEGSVPGG